MTIDKNALVKRLERYREQVGEVRRDWTISDAGKRAELERHYTEARRAYDEYAGEYRRGVRERLDAQDGGRRPRP